ncbi:hypothetical protein T492DRAFT_1145788 [Pavlovales sp. CCMP2436]|nr:hypothetical protein T492DRAFT_1145788 [Pavlovales sp. CCMP2436]
MPPIRSVDIHRDRKEPKPLDLKRPEVILQAMLQFVKEEGHLTWFLRNHFQHQTMLHSMERCTHATRISMGMTIRATVASALTIPPPDIDFVYALLFAVNEVGEYTDRTYLTQKFPGLMLKAHLEIDHVEGSVTVLNKAVMTDLLKNIAQEYKCEVFARVRRDFRDKCTVWLEDSIPNLDSYLALDDSTARSRVIRAPFARSPKAHRQDQYAPWLIYAHAKKNVCDAAEMNMTIGDWIQKTTMTE